MPATPTITLPSGFSGCTATGSTTSHVVTVTLAGASCALANGTAGTLTIAGITNPAAGTYTNTTFSVATSQDTTAASPGSNVVINGATTPTAVSFSPASAAANASSTWTVGFTTSASGKLAAGNTIAVTINSSFTVPATPTITLPSGFSGCTATGSTTSHVVTVTLAGASCALANGTAGTLTIAGITNPGAGLYGNTTFSVATSEDTVAASPASGVTITATTPTSVSFSGSPQTANSTATWTAGFTTSASGKLAAGNTIAVTFPASFTVPATPTITLPSGFSGCTATGSTTSHVVTVTLAGASCALANGTAGTLTIAGITNPAAGTYTNTTFSVATSQDTTAASPGSNVVINGATTPTAVSFSPASAAANASSTWTVGFTTSASGKLAAGNTIAVTISSSFTVPATPTITLPSGFSGCTATGSTTSHVVTVTLAGASCALANGTAGTLTIAGITNPGAGLYGNTTFSVATSQDTVAASPASGVTITATTPTSVSFSGSPQTANSTATWTAGFTTSASGKLAAGNTIAVTFPGFTVPVTPTITLPSGSGLHGHGMTTSNVVTVTFAARPALAIGSPGLTIAGITNPGAGLYGNTTFSVATSQDTVAASPASGNHDHHAHERFLLGLHRLSNLDCGLHHLGERQAAGNTIASPCRRRRRSPCPAASRGCTATGLTTSHVVTVTLAGASLRGQWHRRDLHHRRDHQPGPRAPTPTPPSPWPPLKTPPLPARA